MMNAIRLIGERPEDVAALQVGLASVELHRARAIAAVLPKTTTLSGHAERCLQIGLIGRRARSLLESAGYDLMRASLATIPDDSATEGPERCLTYGELFKVAGSWVNDSGWGAYDARTTLQSLASDPGPAVRSPISSVDALIDLGRSRAERPEVTRSRRGSAEKLYDPRWRFVPRDGEVQRIKRIDTPMGLLQKLHHTAFRETVAAEVAALNLYEYDGLPAQFYVDMMRQVEDEARHALLAQERLEGRGGTIGQFPLSFFGSYYHMFWEMTLSERLVVMNLDTEAEGDQHLRDLERRLRDIGAGDVARMYSFIERDERRHALYGARWLSHLFPDVEDRASMIDAARALTVINLASNYACLEGVSVADAVDVWLRNGHLIRFEPKTIEDEEEVSLTTAQERTRHN